MPPALCPKSIFNVLTKKSSRAESSSTRVFLRLECLPLFQSTGMDEIDSVLGFVRVCNGVVEVPFHTPEGEHGYVIYIVLV